MRGDTQQPSIFTARDSYGQRSTATPRTSSPFRRPSAPGDCLEQEHQTQRVLSTAEERAGGRAVPPVLSVATAQPNRAASASDSAHPVLGSPTWPARVGGSGSGRQGESRASTQEPLLDDTQTPDTSASIWASLAVGDSRTEHTAARGRSASEDHTRPSVAVTPPKKAAPSPFRTPVFPAAAALGDSSKRKWADDRPASTSEPSHKRLRFQGPRLTLKGSTFGPSAFNQPPPQPPSPLFFSNSPRPRLHLPPRFSSSEAAAKMLSKARNEDSHVKTVSLARGSVTPANPVTPTPMTFDRSSMNRSRSMETAFSVASNGGWPVGGMLDNVGVTELLELDERPTFVVDLADSTNYGTGLLRLVFANSSLRGFHGMQEVVTGAAPAENTTSPLGSKTYLQFKSWLLSSSVNSESLNVCSPPFVYAGVTWSCSTLRKRIRIIKAAFAVTDRSAAPLRSNVSASRSTRSPSAADVAPEEISAHTPAMEADDYFGGAVVSPPAISRTTPPGILAARKTEVIPTIERPSYAASARIHTSRHDPESAGDLIAPRHTDYLSAATELLPSSRTYVAPPKPASPASMFHHTHHDLGHPNGGGDVGRAGGMAPASRETSSSTIDSARSHIPTVSSDSPSFDWTRLAVTDSMPQHIRFARSVDWANTGLGPIEEWSSDLRQMCNLIMASPHPAAMYWGEDLIAIYNEAYIMLAGQKHPKLMGQSYREAWHEIWDDVKEVFSNAKSTGEATMKDDDCLFIKRGDYLEETYFSWSIIPMVGRGGGVMGLYNPAFEKTRRKIAERRMLTLREVGERTASARDVKGFWAQVLASWEFNEEDSPFLLLYSVADELDSDASSIHSMSVLGTRSCFLEGALGVPEGHEAATDLINLKQGMEGFGPAFREVMKTDKPVLLEVGSRELPPSLLEGLDARGFGDLVRAVVVCPIHPTTGENTLGFLVLGVNPRRPYDDDYGLFVQLLSRQLATSLASVVLFEEEIRRGQKAAKLAALDRIELSEQLAARTQEAIESETKFTRMAEFAPVGMFIADGSGKITFANDTWYEISRVPRELTLALTAKDQQWMRAVLPADHELVERLWTDLVVGRKPVSSEFRFKAQWEDRKGKRGDTWVLFSAYPETYEDGRLKGVFGSITNISQQKNVEDAQTRKTAEALEMKRQQENFIDMTSHEMRNPLSAILQCSDEITSGLTRFKESGEGSASLIEMIDSCLDAAQVINLCSQHQKRIVDDILTLSKLDSQLLLVTPVDAQPLTVVQRALKMHEGELQAADIQMKFGVDKSFRDLELDWVRFDPSRVMQVLINLTTNAIKFTGTEKKRTITVSIAASREKPSSDMEGALVQYFSTRSKRKDTLAEREWGEGEVVYICFSVKDTGRGLSPEEKKMLFLRFSQASPRTHVQYGGSGLGLFISRELTELQGGEIGVSSEAGKGSTFAFYVAARRSTAPPDTDGTGMKMATAKSNLATTALAQKAGATENGTAPKMRVLIVEDNLVNQRVLQKQLKNLGTEVHLANHGGEALEMLRRSTYWKGGETGKLELGVVLMDQEMPVMDGLTCTRKIRELEKEGKLTGHLPIIAVTANARAEQVQTALDAGMDDVVSKPFRIPELIPKIEELMQRYPMPSASTS
ncbi:hypothetical protein LTR08_000549 [Meristemomyces frigidus]|nr:hypothetical protein LTR08_000549 [Meristemomyces frigidus]